MTETITGRYAGGAGRLFGLTLSTMALTILTLGIYRFWMKARMRRYYWSSVQLDGNPLEYHGTGVEKLLGFLVAAVFLAVYLLIFNIALSFFGLAFFQGNPAAGSISFLVILPLIFFAQYRARRYILSRTRWRGLRFGVEPVAFQYMWKALGHTILTALTLGLLYPRQHFKLEKFVTDRTWYGDLRMHQNGTWGMLFRPWIAVLATIVLCGLIFTGAIMTNDPMSLLWLLIMIPLFVVSLIFYGAAAFRILAQHKQIGQTVGLRSTIRTGRLVWIYIRGMLAMMLVMILAMMIIFAVGFAYFAAIGVDPSNLGNLMEQPIDGPAGIAGMVFSVLAYFFLMLVISAFSEVVFVQPMLRHYVEELTILQPGELDTARQRPHDASAEAEGFADALDVGAAI